MCLRVVVDNEGDALEFGVFGGEELLDAFRHFGYGFVDTLLKPSEHGTHPDSWKRYRLEASIGSGFETVVNNLVKRTSQVIDHEDNIGECAIVSLTRASSNYRLTIRQRQCFRCLRMEEVASNSIDDVVDVPAPHPSRIDGCNEGVGLYFGDVA